MKKSEAAKPPKRGELEAAARRSSARLAKWPEWKRGGSAAAAKSSRMVALTAAAAAKTR